MEKHRYSEEERAFLKDNYNCCNSYQELTEKFNNKFGTCLKTMTISDYCNKQLGLKGMNNISKFVSGNKSRELPIGTIRKSQTATYIKVKNKDGSMSGYQPPNWMPYQQYVWEKEHGPIQPGEFVIFLDNNRENFDILNLAVINRKISARMAKSKLFTENTELTRTGIMCIELESLLMKGEANAVQ